ncbi:pilus assembly protein [Pseudoxanthomonas winnipegensis]|uniref:PilY1 beta-propeller domain-containing protein n=2 Tax=Pseudoxanthomonas winnipegensis TaxID=2480810 RepID=A0A4Q8LF49_9GAMM|nr:PilC/PilY family type IV pilus protein [Pseudoxanthomonas winnipegensis]RZZ88975.1 hypothetical protein EA662_00865 [Pseudoxanthomonas winnipegensis]TAA27315.1 hypothetical protein EA661_14325 [Pseudoxanthomonas winnipegensis]TBV75601.1 hypothetical protein EYC46_09920 [Pseudoxanthomonas winnipegensis]
MSRQTMNIRRALSVVVLALVAAAVARAAITWLAPSLLSIAQAPLFTRSAIPPLNMLVMGKDHKIYFSAYNDTSDLDGDGIIDVGYRGWVLKAGTINEGESKYKIDYYGYFNSYVCYDWDGSKFVPRTATADKTCNGSTWSGDFLNYLTTSRLDALRKVLYGGNRRVDDPNQTVLEGSFFPQDGHSWGKEYQSQARDGYDIAKYAPLRAPSSGRYHLFAITTLQDYANSNYVGPYLRVLQNTPTRVFNWLSIEAPVAGNKCFNASNQRVDCVTNGTADPFPGHPANASGFDQLEANYAAYQFGNGSISTINCTSNCNLYSSQQDNFLAVMTGTFQASAGSGTEDYQFAVDGDDAVDVQIFNGNTRIGSAGWYGGHGACGSTDAACQGRYATSVMSLRRGASYGVKFRMEDATGSEVYILRYRSRTSSSTAWSEWTIVPPSDGTSPGWSGSINLSTYNLTPSRNPATRQDYHVRVQVCPANEALRDTTCKQYPNGSYKPTGILHDYGEGDRMYFGLITGSQPNNIEGGVLRRNVTSFSSEIDSQTGQFLTNVDGIARTISKLRMIGGAYGSGVTDNTDSDVSFNWGNGNGNCGGSPNPISNGNCRMWGNPIAEMLYESMRYFAGAGAPTPRFVANTSTNGAAEERAMGLSTETWRDPYGANGFPFCAKPFQTIISDINPSYDGDLPGSAFSGALTSTGTTPSGVAQFSASVEGDRIWSQEYGGPRSVFIGDVNGTTDGAPTPKTASSFGNIRGLSPEEPTKNGTYYAGSVARFAHLNDLNGATGAQKLSTYSIALASPLPKFQFGNITILPFGKTVSGTFGGNERKPTNTIVALYIDQLVNMTSVEDRNTNGGRPYASFRISYEDVEQGNDFDMDAIVRYVVAENANGTVTISLTSEYAAGSANQNLGYVISGTTKDGVYLEVRDADSAVANSVYSLNTPTGVDAGGCAASGALNTAPCSNGLGLSATRTFTPSTTSPAIRLQDPLWYAAKYGGFDDSNNDGVPQNSEWDANGDGVPDNYFLVTNPLNLRKQLGNAFDKIESSSGSSGSVAVAGAQVTAGSFAVFPSYSSANNGTDWTGDVAAYRIESNGLRGTLLWSAAAQLPTTTAGAAARKILTSTGPVGPATVRATTIRDFTAANLGSSRAQVLARLGYPNESDFNNDFGANMSADSLVSFLRGDRTLQGGIKNSTPYRARSSVMGDVINSNPVIATKLANYGWSASSGLGTLATSYTAYVNSKSSRREITFVGANDGMLHAFGDNGAEISAYIPNALLERDRATGLGYLARPDYTHRYYMDGKLTLADMPISNTWQTVLAAGIGAGQKGAFGLNVTRLTAATPTPLGPSDVLWEVNDRTDGGDRDIGNVLGQPVVVPLQNKQWVALFGNGYNSINGDPVLYVVDMATGEVLNRIKPTGWKNLLTDWLAQFSGNVASPMNGLGNIVVADSNGDGLVDMAYGGDLQGNVWKFDLSGATQGSWSVGATPLFTAKDPDGNRQPITGGLELSVGPNGGYMVYFGTGRYFANGDSSTKDLQTVYGIWDKLDGTTVTGRNSLAQQTILSDDATTPPTRSVSTNGVNYLNQRGWYMDLALKDNGGNYIKRGERMIGNPRIQSGRIYFPTYIPGVGADCVPGGVNWLYGLNPLSGAASLGQIVVPPSTTAVGDGNTGGVSSGSGAPSQGVGITQPTPGLPAYCDPADSTCNPVAPANACSEVVQDPINPSQSLSIQRTCGRQSWRQLR